MSEVMQARLRAVVVAVAPVVGLIAAFYHPYIGDLAGNAETARVVAADPTRWAWAHVILMGAHVLLVLAIVWIGSYLRASGERLWSFIAVPLITAGIVLFTAVLGMSVSFSAMNEVGAPLEAVLDAVDPWYLPITFTILITAGLGFLSLAAAIYRSRVLSRELSWVVSAAIVVVTLTLLIPASWGEQVFNVAAIVAFWPLACRMWLDTTEAPGLVMGPASSRSARTV